METLIELFHANVSIAGRRILTDVSLRIEKGDFIELIGANGGGKTTLLRLLAGLLPADSGSVKRKEGLTIGYLPQFRGIDRQFPITVGEVVRSGLHNRTGLFLRLTQEQQDAVSEFLARFSLTALADRSIEALSGGQWQRALIARALVSKPDVLLLDEPETHLDMATKDLLHEVLHEASQRSAIVRVSHDHMHRTSFHPTRIYEVEGGVRSHACPLSHED